MNKAPPTVVWDRLAIFSALWAGAYLFHIVGYELFRTAYPFTLFTTIAAVWLLMNPRSTPLLAALAIAQLAEYWVQSPLRSNHTLIIALINAAIVLLMAQQMARRGRFFVDRQQLYAQLAFVIRWSVPIIYFWAGFHKLNTSFLNPDASCVAIYYQRMAGNYPILPQADWLVLAAIYGTIVIELGLALLFALRRTAFWAVLIGVGFHFVLGFDNFRDFSWLMMTLYTVFIPDAVIDTVRGAIKQRLPQGQFTRLLWVVVIGLGGLICVGLLPGMVWWRPQFAPPQVVLPFAFLVIVIWLPILWVWWRQPRPSQPNRLGATPLGLALVVITLLNGTGPYIGFKTNNSFDMYSNLRVEAGSNHLLFPAYGQWIDAPNDLVEILGARGDNVNALNHWRDEGFLLPFIEFRRLVYRDQPEYVAFVRGEGEPQRLTPDTYEAILGPPDPIWSQKFRLYGEVNMADVTPCGF